MVRRNEWRSVKAILFAGGLVGLLPLVSVAESLPTLAERMEMAFRYAAIPGRMPGLALLEPRWLPDGDRFWYAERAREDTVIHLVDPVANTRVELFDVDRLREALERNLGHPPAHRGLPFDDFSFVGDDEGAVRFAVDGQLYEMGLASYEIRELDEAPTEEPSALEPGGRWYRDWVGPFFGGRILGVPSPDGAWTLEEEDHDLWLRSTRGEPRRRLTTDGEADHRWHVVHPLASEWGWGGPPPLGNWFDGRFVAAWRSDRRGLPPKPVVHWREPFGHPLHRQHRVRAVAEIEWELAAMYPVDLYIGELGEHGVRWVKVDSGEPNPFLGGFRWRPDGSELWFHREVDWSRRLDLLAGSVTVLQRTSSDLRLNPHVAHRFDGEAVPTRRSRCGLLPPAAELYPEDGVDPRLLSGGSGRSSRKRVAKTMQLCRQVERALSLAIARPGAASPGPARRRGGQHLDRDLAPQPQIPGPVHLAHAARAERPRDLAAADAGPGSSATLWVAAPATGCSKSRFASAA